MIYGCRGGAVARTLRRPPTRFLALFSLLTQASPLVAQQVCENGIVSEVTVVTQDIFPPDDAGESELGAIPRFLDLIHWRTKPAVLEREFRILAGDCYDASLVDETARLIRNFGFISEVDVSQERIADGSWRINYVTQDDISFKFGLGISFDAGFNLEGLTLAETNFFGQGMTVGVFAKELRERQDAGVEYEAPRLFGSRWRPYVSGGKSRNGYFMNETVYLPFATELDRFAARQVYDFREDYFPYSVNGTDFSQVVLPMRAEFAEISAMGRVGRAGAWWLFGAGLSRDVLEFPDFPSSTGIVVDDKFSTVSVAGPGETDAVRPQAQERSSTRASFTIGRRSINFVPRSALDGVLGLQDVEKGSEVTVTIAPSLSIFGKSGVPSPDDVYGRLRIFGTTVHEQFVGALEAQVEGRKVRAGGPTGEGWRDVLTEVDLYGFLQPRFLPNHTVFARISAAEGRNPEQPFQLTLGGRAGVRGYDQDAYPGARRLLLTLEDRFPLGWNPISFADIGVSVFADAGRVWAGDAPFGVDSGWKASVGAGLRLGIPTGSIRVTRIDFVLPLSGDKEELGIYFRIAGEITGLLSRGVTRSLGALGLADSQMKQARRSGISTDYANRPVR